jgi:hypothetical protein
VRLLLVAAILLGLARTASAASSPPAAIPFTTYGKPYFVRNDFQPGVPRSYVVIRSWTEFGTVFGLGTTMGGPRATIGPDLFRAKMLLVAIERGPLCAFVSAKVDRTASGIALVYGLRCPGPSSATFAVPLIVAIDRSDAPVSFVENGRTIDVVHPAR